MGGQHPLPGPGVSLRQSSVSATTSPDWICMLRTKTKCVSEEAASRVSLCSVSCRAFQLCVNITNERLRQHVSEVLFQQEQAECLREGVAMETPRSPCEQPAVLDFFLQVGVVGRGWGGGAVWTRSLQFVCFVVE